MIRGTSRLVAAGAALSLLLGSATGVAAPPRKQRAQRAARYIIEQQKDSGAIVTFSKIASTADGIVALAAARRSPGPIADAIGYLRDKEAKIDSVGEKAKVIMALVATGRNPRAFEGRNLVEEIEEGQEPDGHYGAISNSWVYDQTLSIQALSAAGVEVPTNAIDWLADAQCEDGGWQFDLPSAPSPKDNEHCFGAGPADYTTSDTNTTALAVMAFEAADANVLLLASPFNFFPTARDRIKKGWVFAPQFACAPGEEPPDCSVTDANSTSLVIQAYASESVPIPNGDRARASLRKLQYKFCGPNAGAFALTWTDDEGTLTRGTPDLGATMAAVTGVLEKPFPIPVRDISRSAPTAGPC